MGPSWSSCFISLQTHVMVLCLLFMCACMHVLTFISNTFISYTTSWILTKLDRNDPGIALFRFSFKNLTPIKILVAMQTKLKNNVKVLAFYSKDTHFNPLPDDKILDWSKLKQIADDILKCILNGKQVPYRVENILRKWEIACIKQFVLFSQCFPHLYIFSVSECVIVW